MTRAEMRQRIGSILASLEVVRRVALAHDGANEATQIRSKNPLLEPLMACAEQYVEQAHLNIAREMDELLDDVFGVDEQGNPIDELAPALADVKVSEEGIDRLVDHLREHREVRMGAAPNKDGNALMVGKNDVLVPSLKITRQNAKDVFEALAAAYYVMMEG